ACGNGLCSAATENCFTCPSDCGICPGCGDGSCGGTETCASCPPDCGVCSVCPNGKCEDYETCAICPADCGQCQPIGCLEIVFCALQCIDLEQEPPQFSIACVANCVALGCADVQFFVDQVLTCAVTVIPECGGDAGCIQKECDEEFAACIGATCN
ncbi:MAG: hypothetical protein HUU21_20980, partial [Polyangiaceae bacterium]|nr:hypothetical protein [Polyangiaceae bacterium]